jgi:DNA-binding transcriptional LysR family regulator
VLGCKLFQKPGNKLLLVPSEDVLLAFTRPWFEKMEKVRRKVDLALTVEPEENKKYPFIPCFPDELVMVMPRDNEWTLKGGIDWTATGREKLILPHRKSYSYLAIQKYLEKCEIKLSFFMEMNSSETTKKLIKAKMGMGILPDWFISPEVNAKELVALPLGPKRLIRPWGVSHFRGETIGTGRENFY